MSRAPKIPDEWGGPDDGSPKALRLVEAPEVTPGQARLFPFPAALAIAGLVLGGVVVAGTMIWVRMAVALPSAPASVLVVDSPKLEDEPREDRPVERQPEALPPAPLVMVPITVEASLPDALPTPDVEVPEQPFEVAEIWEAAAEPFPEPVQPKLVAKPTPKPTAKVAQRKTSASRSLPKPRAVKRSPQVARQVPPTYPAAARRAGVEGAVLLQVAVQSNGRAGSVSLVSSSGSGLLDAAAIRAVKKWSFHPATLNGEPTSGEVRVPVRFQLR